MHFSEVIDHSCASMFPSLILSFIAIFRFFAILGGMKTQLLFGGTDENSLKCPDFVELVPQTINSVHLIYNISD